MRKLTHSDSGKSFSDMLRELEHKNFVIRDSYYELKRYCDLRNAISHWKKGVVDAIAEPNAKCVADIQKIEKELKIPPTALDKGITDIFSCELGNSLKEVLNTMITKNYTTCPVKNEEGIVQFVLSENSVVRFLADNIKNNEVYEEVKTVGQLTDYLDRPNAENPASSYYFVKSSSSVYDVYDLFHNKLKSKIRISAVFVNDTGKANEPIKGMFTSWDIPEMELK